MAFEETTGTLFSSELFSSPGVEQVVPGDASPAALCDARLLGRPDPTQLRLALDKLNGLPVRVVAPSRGPAILGRAAELFHSFREAAVAA
jgi:hypothetical protein